VEELATASPVSSHSLAVAAAREEIDALRASILAGGDPDLASEHLRESVGRRASWIAAGTLRRVINATGVVLHTNLGRAPLAADAAAAAAVIATGYSNLEFDLEAGERGSRHAHLETLLCELSGAEAAIAVNNNAAAVLLALAATAAGREVIVSRGELIEIGGSFRIPEILAQSGAELVEVGTTNRTRLADYEEAIGPKTAAILRVHQSNFRTVGFTAAVPTAELAALTSERRHRRRRSGLLLGRQAAGRPAGGHHRRAFTGGCGLPLPPARSRAATRQAPDRRPRGDAAHPPRRWLQCDSGGGDARGLR
jgi:L-seryl-tRNA(Ser) seleniumtransferase